MKKESMVEIAKKRREWVNSELARLVSGKSMSNKKKTILLRKLWRKAKKKYK